MVAWKALSAADREEYQAPDLKSVADIGGADGEDS